ncbi:transportin-1-like isoform X3 [Hylaeus volcanicus]|uniref:transportin-1-like isoform X3 n=1 Tax=Hylaeus volcanicus TaxID=313075 RepID=UPI0023B7FB2E|nr:transportin-1-like isoform X3 [Hylaeus volcanicus]
MSEILWEPDSEVLGLLLSILNEAGIPNTAVQSHVAESINNLNKKCNIACYYAFLFSCLPDCDQDVRQRAGLLLKTRIPFLFSCVSGKADVVWNVEDNYLNSHPLEKRFQCILQYVKNCIMKGMCDSSTVIRHTAATILTTLAHSGSKEETLELLSYLIQLLEHQNSDIRNTSFRPIAMIIEDELKTSYKSIDYSFMSFSEKTLFPKIFSACNYDSTFRYYCVLCLNQFNSKGCFSPNEVFHHHLQSYWELLGKLALDPSIEVRQETLRGMGLMVMRWYKVVADSLESLLPFLIQCIDVSQPYNIKLEASDVLRHIVFVCDKDEPLKCIIPLIIPKLFINTRYSEWDYAQMDQQQFYDDSEHYLSKSKDIHNVSNATMGNNATNDDDDDDDEFEDESNGMLTSTWGTNWTLRKASAVLLDRFSFRFGDLILPYVLPQIDQWLKNVKVWESRETAILVLGAIARGCLNGLRPFLADIIQVLIQVCDDSRPILRSISVWAISRFSPWICTESTMLETVVIRMLRRILDGNQCVQEAACSAFAFLEETAADKLLPFLPSIMSTFHQAFSILPGKNVIVLLDAIIVLIEVINVWKDLPCVHQNIVEPLLQRWINVSCECPSFTALCESVSRLIFEANKDIASYKHVIWRHCLVLVQQGLDQLTSVNNFVQSSQASRTLVSCDTVSVEYRSNAYTATTSLESGVHIMYMLCDIFQEDIKPCFETIESRDMIIHCYTKTTKDERIHGNVKHDCLGVLSYILSYTSFQPTVCIPTLVPLVTDDIDSPYIGICCNAVCCLEKIVASVFPSHDSVHTSFFMSYNATIMEKLAGAFIRFIEDESAFVLYDKLVSAIPYVARVSSPPVVHMISDVFDIYVQHINTMKHSPMKTQAVQGILILLSIDPMLAFNCLSLLLETILSLFMDVPLTENHLYPDGTSHNSMECHQTVISTLSQLEALDPCQFRNALTSLDASYQHCFQNLSSYS